MGEEKLLKSIENDIVLLEKKTNLNFEEILNILKQRKKDKKEKTLPLSIFNKNISALETIVKYLKDNLNLSYTEIASLLNRNYDPIAITYRNSKKKFQKTLDISSHEKVPLSIFREKDLSILENLVSYLKLNLRLSFHQIAVLLQRDDRTIWTVYKRALKKRVEPGQQITKQRETKRKND